MVGAVLLNANLKFHFSRSDQATSPALQVKPKPKAAATAAAAAAAVRAQSNWAPLQADMEAHLKKAIPVNKEPVEVFQPMQRLALASPQSTVPALCLAACELVGGKRQQAMAAASALLLNMASTHAHQHIPLTGVELMIGDGIVALGFELLAQSISESEERVLRVITEISRAVGSGGLQEAQYMNKTLTLDGDEDDVDLVRLIVEKNEGGLHACGAACGAILGGATEYQIQSLREFGFHVGMLRGLGQRGFNHQHLQHHKNLALNHLQSFNHIHHTLISTFLYF